MNESTRGNSTPIHTFLDHVHAVEYVYDFDQNILYKMKMCATMNNNKKKDTKIVIVRKRNMCIYFFFISFLFTTPLSVCDKKKRVFSFIHMRPVESV
jgi:hypothetical protein